MGGSATATVKVRISVGGKWDEVIHHTRAGRRARTKFRAIVWLFNDEKSFGVSRVTGFTGRSIKRRQLREASSSHLDRIGTSLEIVKTGGNSTAQSVATTVGTRLQFPRYFSYKICRLADQRERST